MKFTAVNPEEIRDNVFRLVGKDWMLVTAGTLRAPRGYNTMTASWGGFGILWGKPVCFIVVRPGRHTRRFIEKADHFTLSFFGEKYRKALDFCGANSGRDVDKALETGLTPAEDAGGSVYFTQARMVVSCRKAYFSDLDPVNFLDDSINKNYPKKDYHRMYFGEITAVMRRGK